MEGGGERSEKKYSCKGKLNEKNSCTPINRKKYSCYGLKNSYKEFDNEKKSMLLENPSPPPHHFSNGPSLKTGCSTENRSDQSETALLFHKPVSKAYRPKK